MNHRHWLIAMGILLQCACADPARRRLGEVCSDDGQCESGLCLDQVCVDPLADADHDGIPNGQERAGSGGPGADASGPDGSVPDALGTGPTAGADTATASAGDDTTGVIPDASTTAPDASVRRIYDVFFTPNIDVSVCTPNVQWSSQNLQVDGDGHFDEVWSLHDPNTVHIAGTVDATTFSASFACTKGAPATTLVATRSGATYTGTFSFNGSSGSFTVQPPGGL